MTPDQGLLTAEAPAERAGERTIRIPVTGMTCAACQARVQRTLQRQPGVVDAGVNLMMGNATVRYAPMLLMPVVPMRATSYALLVLTVAVMAWAGRHFYTRAWAAIRHHSADMNTLIAIGTGAAFLYSLALTLAPELFARRGVPPDVYHEAVIVIIALILTGIAFEARAKRAATWCSCDRASGCRWTARSSRARALLTRRCSPASRRSWRSARATG